jgi:predicted acyltransferase
MIENNRGKVRILSLDFFRGLTIASMILVNTPGDGDHVYAPLQHSEWHGCSPTDLVFPFFLFMVGVSIVYALSTKKLDASNHNKIILGASRRMLILIALGLSIFLFSRFDFTHLRFPGVLQRIGIVYFISTIIYLKTAQRTRDWLFGMLLVIYYLLLTYVPIPDGHAPNLTPHHNVAAWLDRAIFTTNHMYRHTVYWDPVGLLSTLPAIATALFGIRVGEVLKRKDISVNKVCGTLLIVGITATILGLLADKIFPINKQLWTSSYVLYTGGLCTIGLTAAYWLIDVKGYKRFTWIFVVFGTNAISAYVLAEFMPGIIDLIKFHINEATVGGRTFIYETLFAPHFSPINASLFFACAFVLFIWLIMYIMYRRKIIIKV